MEINGRARLLPSYLRNQWESEAPAELFTQWFGKSLTLLGNDSGPPDHKTHPNRFFT